MFEFVFTQMTNANTQSSDKFDSSMIFTIKNIIGGWLDTFQDIAFESTKASNISNVIVKIVPLDEERNKFLEKLCFVLKRGMSSANLMM